MFDPSCAFIYRSIIFNSNSPRKANNKFGTYSIASRRVVPCYRSAPSPYYMPSDELVSGCQALTDRRDRCPRLVRSNPSQCDQLAPFGNCDKSCCLQAANLRFDPALGHPFEQTSGRCWSARDTPSGCSHIQQDHSNCLNFDSWEFHSCKRSCCQAGYIPITTRAIVTTIRPTLPPPAITTVGTHLPPPRHQGDCRALGDEIEECPAS